MRMLGISFLLEKETTLDNRSGKEKRGAEKRQKRCQTFFFSRKRPENVNGAGFLNQ
jgi:hypothetical protein